MLHEGREARPLDLRFSRYSGRHRQHKPAQARCFVRVVFCLILRWQSLCYWLIFNDSLGHRFCWLWRIPWLWDQSLKRSQNVSLANALGKSISFSHCWLLCRIGKLLVLRELRLVGFRGCQHRFLLNRLRKLLYVRDSVCIFWPRLCFGQLGGKLLDVRNCVCVFRHPQRFFAQLIIVTLRLLLGLRKRQKVFGCVTTDW